MADPGASDYPPAKRTKRLHQDGPISGPSQTFSNVATAPGLSMNLLSVETPINWAPDNGQPALNSTVSWQPLPHLPPLPDGVVDTTTQPSTLGRATQEPATHITSTTGSLAPMNPAQPDVASQPSRLPRLLPAASDTSPAATKSAHSKVQRKRKNRNKNNLVSPFKDSMQKFGDAPKLRFPRPPNGAVNGYVKFHWATSGPSASQPNSAIQSPVDDVGSSAQPSAALQPRTVCIPNRPMMEGLASTQSLMNVPQRFPTVAEVTISTPPNRAGSGLSLGSREVSIAGAGGAFVFASSAIPYASQPDQNNGTIIEYRQQIPNSAVEQVTFGVGIQYPPPQFGFGARMDSIDQRFFNFYIRNWCPGRTILDDSNLWLKDFASMHSNDGIRAAIQSLAGIYIYDYMPLDTIRHRVLKRFSEAENRFGELINSPTRNNPENASEIITLSVLLSMQDIVFTENRLQKPYIPRWLQGFRYGERFLQSTDQGARFWNNDNVQTSSLHNAHCIMIGRGIILSQAMMVLPAPSEFNAAQETARFGWLLYGTPAEMYEIHGGCGFSKKLLHIFSQISYCAARLQQERESPFVPRTADTILQVLDEMRQWSKRPIDSRKNDCPPMGPAAFDWETAKRGQSTIEWLRSCPPNFQIISSKDMTDVTAEAWRIAAIIYLQCRVLRLPRNDPAVMQRLGDLARCIEVMPTSGYHFTAQAPLFPVFLLGVAATAPEHKKVAMDWFQNVVETPVRSSVPPLYYALGRIRRWMDKDPEFQPRKSQQTQDGPIYERRPWWERLVTRIQEKEKETLCLT